MKKKKKSKKIIDHEKVGNDDLMSADLPEEKVSEDLGKIEEAIVPKGSGFAALDTYLKPIQCFLDEEGVNEVLINRPGEVWIEKRGDVRKELVPDLDFNHMRGLAKLVAQYTEQKVSEEMPLLSANLPNGNRVQFVLPPACETRTVAAAIRKPSQFKLDLDACEKMGMFESMVAASDETEQVYQELKALLNKRDIKSFIRTAVLKKKNIIVSGGTSTGKTTFTNAVMDVIPSDERIVTIEDAREITLPNHPNHIHLLSSKGGQGRAKVTTNDLLEACLRLRPDRVNLGELRGEGIDSFLRMLNTGHSGSISTIHADTPVMAIEQMKLMFMQTGLVMPPAQIKEYIINVVDVIVQLKRGEKGKRFVSDILLTKTLMEKKNKKKKEKVMSDRF